VFTTTLETSIGESIFTTTSEMTTTYSGRTSTILTAIPENITLPENETSTTTTVETTTTINETSIVTTATIETTLETTTTIELNISKPILNIELNLPEKVTRGEIFNISAKITNDGTVDATNVVLNWDIPEKFGIVSGDLTNNCGTIPSDSFCSAELTVSTSIDTDLGNNLIKTVVSYES